MNEIERVFVRFRGRTIGPFTPEKLRDMVRRGQVTRMHELSGDGLSWMKAEEFGNFFPRAVVHGGAAGDMAASADHVPPSEATGPAVNENATSQWYVHVNGEKQGPVSLDQIRLYAEAKLLKKDSLVWKAGMQAWKPAAEALPDLFGPGAKGKTVVSPSSNEHDGVDAGPLASELCRSHGLVMTLGVALLLVGAIVLAGKMTVLTQTVVESTADVMAAVAQISLALLAVVAGCLAVQLAGKLKMAREATSPIAALVAAKTLSRFWLITAIATGVWLGVLLVLMVAAAATGVPVTDVLL